MADTKTTALSEVSVPDLEDLFYLVEDPAGTPTSRKMSGYRAGGLLVPQVCQGRLTTESGVPVSTSDRIAQGTLYWTPCTPEGKATASGLVGFWDGTRYVVRSLTQLSLSLATAEAGGAIDVNEIYDVFIDYNGGSPALVIGPSWTNNTTRSTALTTQGPLVVLTGDTDWRWVGTIRASGSGVTADSIGNVTTQVGGKRFVWNAYNQQALFGMVKDTTYSWSYTTDTIRISNGATAPANCVEWVTGDAASIVSVDGFSGTYQGGDAGYGSRGGVGLDGTTFVGCFTERYNPGASAWIQQLISHYTGQPGLGYHYFAWLEKGSDGTCEFHGTTADEKSYGLIMRILG